MLQGDQLTIADSEDRLNFTRDKPRNAFYNPLSKVHLAQFSVHNLKFHMLPLDEPRVLGLRENFIFPHGGTINGRRRHQMVHDNGPCVSSFKRCTLAIIGDVRNFMRKKVHLAVRLAKDEKVWGPGKS